MIVTLNTPKHICNIAKKILILLSIGISACLPLKAWGNKIDTHEYQFKNGLRLIVKEDHRAPTVAHMVWYRAGSMDEVNGKTGVAHVLEHMMFKGTKKVKSGDFSRMVAAVGGRENAFTAKDFTGYFQQIEKSKLADVMRLEADRMANLQFSDDEFLKEIQVVMEERRLRTDDNPNSLLRELMMATAFTSSSYRHPIIGWMNDLQNMKPNDARQWYLDWYAPNNAIVVVVGDVKPLEIKALVEKYYGPIAAKKLPERKPQIEPEQKGVKRANLKAPADSPQIMMAWKVPKLDPKKMDETDPYALAVLSAALSGHDNSRLNRELVRNKRLANNASASYDPISRGPELFAIGATTAKGQSVSDLEKGIWQTIQEIAVNGITEAELKRIKTQLLASQIYKRDSIFAQAMEIGSAEIAHVSWKNLDQIIERIQQIQSEQVKAVAKQYFIADTLTVVTLDPQARTVIANPKPPLPFPNSLRH
ncbi:MAG: insulinase family protein [Burkholderiaceae bacterium]|jgi:zinc protease|nr:insulinase family protein [Burkholderiaceae bacterium]